MKLERNAPSRRGAAGANTVRQFCQILLGIGPRLGAKALVSKVMLPLKSHNQYSAYRVGSGHEKNSSSSVAQLESDIAVGHSESGHVIDWG